LPQYVGGFSTLQGSNSSALGATSEGDFVLGAGCVPLLGGAVLGGGALPWARAGIAHVIDAAISAALKQVVKNPRDVACIAASLPVTTSNYSAIKSNEQS
jgi:hypothetical protein